jgi:hypothetical protein
MNGEISVSVSSVVIRINHPVALSLTVIDFLFASADRSHVKQNLRKVLRNDPLLPTTCL